MANNTKSNQTSETIKSITIYEAGMEQIKREMRNNSDTASNRKLQSYIEKTIKNNYSIKFMNPTVVVEVFIFLDNHPKIKNIEKLNISLIEPYVEKILKKKKIRFRY